MKFTNTYIDTSDREFLTHIADNIEQYEGEYFDDLHHFLFNENYYIIGYYQSEKWMKEHNFSAFDLIQYCQDREKENFGEIQSTFDNAEKLVNHYAYWRGQELLYSLDSIGDYTGGTMISDGLIKEVQKEVQEKLK